MDERQRQIAQDNPDLPVSMIEDILAAQAESEAGLGEPYRRGVLGEGPPTELLG